MTDADFRTTWVQAQINELHGPGRLSYAEIARRAGVSKQYFGQVKDGAPPSDRLIEGLCAAFNLEPPKPPNGKRVVDAVKSPVDLSSTAGQAPDTVPRADYDELLTMLKTNTRLLNAALDRLDTLAGLAEQLVKR